ncbi:MAG: radical SAM protein [Candidatus Sericytochromatia bacterium]|nr:radical SAM protein [Candidatus Tanganyikabacteria bacterium]
MNPHYALRGIAGHLRANGIACAVRDLNVEYYEHVLTPEYLREVRDELQIMAQYAGPQAQLAELLGETTRQTIIDAHRARAVENFVATQGSLLEEVPRKILDAVETFRDSRRFYNPDLLVEAFAIVDTAMQIVSLPYHPARMSLNFFEQPDCLLTVDNLIQTAADPRNNMFRKFYEAQLDSLLAEEADYIGVSINAFSQVVPGLTLAYLLKEHAPPGTLIGVGGNFFERVKDTLKERPRFFEAFCDNLVVGEGEQTVLLLMQALRSGGTLDDVPNMLYLDKDRGVVVETTARPVPQMDRVGCQDLAGLPLDSYLTPELVLTVQAGKGCYWGLCSFCDSFWGVTEDTKSLDRLVAEIRYLRDTYGARQFQFIDEAIRPQYMRAMAERFIAEDLDITWFCNGRLEIGFTPDLMQLLFDSGLRLVLWGVETGSRRIHEAVKKGVPFEKRLPLLRGSAEAGIWNFAYIFFGFPTETVEEAQSTIDMLCANTDIIHSYGRSVFTLGRHSPLYYQAEKDGVLEVFESIEEVSANAQYRIKSDVGMSDQELQTMLKRCTDECVQAYGHGLWFFLRYREFMHLYIQRFGAAYVSGYKMPRLALAERQYY